MKTSFELPYNKGFTLLEILVVITILGILSAISVVALKDLYRYSALKVSTNGVYRAFTDARNRTLASEGDTVYGVFVGTSSVTRFVGSTYSIGASTNKVYYFTGGVSATGTIVSTALPVVFTRLTGQPSASGTVMMNNDTHTATNTITIYATGLIE